MEFDSLADQLDWVMGRFFSFLSGLVGEEERKELDSIPNSVRQLAAFEIAKHRDDVAAADDESALRKISDALPTHADRIREIYSATSEQDRAKLKRYVCVICELLA